MQINIRFTSNYPELTLHFDVEDTVYHLRQAISKEMNVGMESFYLCYDQEMLDDQNILDDYGMQEGAVVYCVVKPMTDNCFLAKLEDGNSIEVSFRLTDTVQKVKRVIAERAYGKRCRLSMLYKGVVMKDKKELKEYKLKNKEEIIIVRSYS